MPGAAGGTERRAARSAAIQLNPLQQVLEAIYEVAAGHDVDDFVITDPELLRHIEDGAGIRPADEKLLVRQEGDDVDLALYLDSALVDRLGQDDPVRSLHEGNLADFCTAIEGVSHFLYLAWKAAADRGVSCLELEMQAEVDKYVATVTVLSGQRRRYVAPQLRRWLFEDPVFDRALSADELARYSEANLYAGRYCRQLEQRYLAERAAPSWAMFEDLRRFYRLGLHEKVRRIERSG